MGRKVNLQVIVDRACLWWDTLSPCRQSLAVALFYFAATCVLLAT